MECFWISLAIGCLALGPLLAIIALVRQQQLSRAVEGLRRDLRREREEPAAATEVPAATPAPPAPASPAPPPLPPRRAAAGALPEPPPLPEPGPPSPEPVGRAGRRPEARRRGASSPDLETVIGSRWLVRIGAAALFLGVAFLMKHGFDQGWLGPTQRILGGTTAGLGLWGAGVFWRQRYPAFAQAVFATGSGVLFLSVWAARSLYDLMSVVPAFGAMLVITAATLQIAHATRALAPAILGLCGGFLTPLLVGSELEQPLARIAYAALLSVAAWLLRWRHGWLPLGPLAVVGSAALVLGFLDQHGSSGAPIALAVGTGLLCAVQLAAGPALGSRRGQTLHAADLAAMASCAVLCWLLLWIARDETGSAVPTAVVLGLAVLHGAAGWWHRRRMPTDAPGVEALWLTGAALAALSLGFFLEDRGLTVALCALAVLLVRTGTLLCAVGVRVVGNAAASWAASRVVRDLPWEVAAAAKLTDGATAAIPFANGDAIVDALVVGTLVTLGLLQRNLRAWPLAVAALLAVPIVARELLGWLVPAQWPHPQLAFNRSLAWALPLAGVTALAARSRGEGLRAVSVLAGFLGLVLTGSLVVVGSVAGEGLGRYLQYACMAAVIGMLALAAWRATRDAAENNAEARSLQGFAVLAVHALAVVETLRLLQQSPGDQAPLIVLGFAALLVAWTWTMVPQVNLPRVSVREVATPLVIAPLAFALTGLLGGGSLWPPGFGAHFGTAAAAVAVAAAARRLLGENGDGQTGADLAATLCLCATVTVVEHLQTPHRTLLLNVPFLLAALPVAVLAALLVARPRRPGPPGLVLTTATWLTAVVLCSGESYRWAVQSAVQHGWGDRAGQVALSLTWTACAAASLAVGFLLRAPGLRVLALVLFGFTLAKAVIFDLAELPTPLRILSFLGLGVTLMAAGWLYHRFAARLRGGGQAAPDAD